MLKSTYFMDMYYPSGKEELKAYCQAEQNNEHTPSLILLPHAGIEYVHRMYQEAFAYIHSPQRIVIIAPLHSEKLEKDSDSFLFTLSTGDVETPLGPVTVQAADGIAVSDSYAEEEYTVELFYPYVALNSPSSVIVPVFTALETKEDIQALSRLMVRLKKEVNNSVFIVSGNFTSTGTSQEVNQMARTLKELLENNAPLLEAGSRKKISGCAYKILEAARTAFPGKFSLMMARSGDYQGESIKSDADGRIWQVYAIKE